jgi:hypothetical protein
VVHAAQDRISTAAGSTLDSNGVLREIAEDLAAAGYQVEKSKSGADKISRPVLFGESGQAALTMEIDAFHDGLGIAIEVEAGRAWNGNAVYRDLIRASLLLDARYLALLVPVAYSPQSAKKPIPAYRNTRNLLESIYASQRLRLPFDGVMLLGY